MKTELNVRFEFTKPIPITGREKIKSFIAELSKKLKGMKVNEEIKPIELIIKVKTEKGYPTDFIVQLDRRVKEFFGKNFKIGTKDYEVLDYELEFELENEAPKMNVPFVDKLDIKGKKIKNVHK